MAKQYINPETLSKTGRSTQIVKIGSAIYISGQISSDESGKLIGEGDPEAQARQIYKNINHALTAVGGTMSDIVKTTIYVTNRDYFQAVGKVRQEIWKEKPPANTALVVSGLVNPAYLIEVEAIAVIEN